MSPAELLTLIDSDATATQYANAGNDELCATRLREIAPKEIKKTPLKELGILNLYSNPTDGETVLQTLEQVSTANPVVRRVLKFMQPESTDGPDFGDARVRYMLTLPVQDGGLGLTAELAAPLLAAAEVTPAITAQDVGAAMAQRRGAT